MTILYNNTCSKFDVQFVVALKVNKSQEKSDRKNEIVKMYDIQNINHTCWILSNKETV